MLKCPLMGAQVFYATNTLYLPYLLGLMTLACNSRPHLFAHLFQLESSKCGPISYRNHQNMLRYNLTVCIIWIWRQDYNLNWAHIKHYLS